MPEERIALSSQEDAPLKPALRRLDAPAGWLALVLEAKYPVADPDQFHYRGAVDGLLCLFACFDAPAQELSLQFDRMDPDRDVPLFQQHAPQWFSEIGLGVWPDREPPRLWTRDEFTDAEPGTLRPIMYKLFHLESDVATTRSAWGAMLGSGTLLRIATPAVMTFRERSYAFHRPRIEERSLQAYTSYTSLMEGSAVASASAEEIDRWLPVVDGYARESAEDGGLLTIVRGVQPSWWDELQRRSDVAQLPWRFA